MTEDIDLRKKFSDGFWIDDWFVEPMLNRMSREEHVEQVEPKVMDVLLCMVERPGKAVTKEEFKDRVWADTVVTDDVLSRCISELRKIFRDDSRDPTYIETIRKTGYRLIAPVRFPDAEESSSSQTENEVEPASSTERRGSFRTLLASMSRRLESTVAGSSDGWIAGVGNTIRRRWMLVAAIVLLVGVATGILYGSMDGRSTNAERTHVALPFTSSPGEEIDPALSPNGQQVAYAWRRQDSLYHNIYLMQQGADRPLRLTTQSAFDRSPTWSPDGRFIAHVRTSDTLNQVLVVPSIGGTSREAVRFGARTVNAVDWSPDTTAQYRAISVEQQPHQAYGLVIHDLATDSLRSLTTPPLWSIGDTSPTISPDGSQIAFTRGVVHGVEDIFVVSAEGGNPRQVTTDSTRIAGLTWTQEGTDIVYAARRSGISGLWRIPASGGDPVLVRSASEGTQLTQPSFSPASSRLVYTQRSERVDIWKVSSEQGGTPLLSSTQWDTNPSIGPDGNRIAFVSQRSGHPEIWTADADGRAVSQVTTFAGPDLHSVTWSPDGNRLCFVARRGGQSDVYTIPVDGGTPKRLTDAAGEDLVPRWSNDGRWIYFTSTRSGTWEVWRVPSTGGPVTQVTQGGGLVGQESMDGETLYLVRPDTRGIWAASLDSTKFPLETSSRNSLLAAAEANVSSAPPSSPGNQLLPGLHVRQIIAGFDPEDRNNWWVGEDGIYFLHRSSTATIIALYSPSSGRITPLHRLSDTPHAQSFSVAPNGQWFAFTRVERRESDIMLVEDFE